VKNELQRRHYSEVSGQVWLSNDTITFPLFSFNHKLVGYQQYKPTGTKSFRKDPKKGRYFTIMKEPAVWGLEYNNPNCNVTVVCEGIFKACRFHSYGINAIAVLSNNPEHLKQQLYLLSLSTVLVVVPDPDKPGMKLIKYGTYSIVPNKPVDELTETEMYNLTKQVTELWFI